MLAPDEIPWYFAIPAAVVLWGTYIGIRVPRPVRCRRRHRRTGPRGGRQVERGDGRIGEQKRRHLVARITALELLEQGYARAHVTGLREHDLE